MVSYAERGLLVACGTILQSSRPMNLWLPSGMTLF